jgi:hypothetical protein
MSAKKFSHGGRRPGAGRKPGSGKGPFRALYVPKTLADDVEKFVGRRKLSRLITTLLERELARFKNRPDQDSGK